MPTCDRCGLTRHPLEDYRFWSGAFVEEHADGSTETHETLCNDCHRVVVRT